ncbi:RHS repeat-associated core domain-containing protein [Streptomyces sp. SID13031]|uniref:RHS repeat-associated core domain-containing protein n=1 Tax=Streptomyces sp. SID13031 TaxID=2706046 RepID=UPI0013C6146B|nr:RHS repeat-associated core domain-containing protein [Streptomyces sp. SID13031]NEA30676.1 hypothetical protein [Streptomyces sp. SID13031]
MKARRPIASCTALIVVLGLVSVVPQTSASAATWPPSQPDAPHLVKDFPVPVKPRPVDPATVAAEATTPRAASWPAAGAVDVTLGAPASGAVASARAGGLPLRLGAPTRTVSGGTALPSKVRIELLDRASTQRRGVDGLLLRLRRADGEVSTAAVSLTVDYSAFRQAYGGDWATRLRLVRLTDHGPAQVLPTKNDLAGARLSADVTATAADTTYAVTAAPNGQTGDYKATSLAPAGSWAVSTQSGDFAWSYPITVPSAPGGLAPTLGLSYSSGSVDGHTAATNNQPSWAGEGWSLWPGSIERGYKSCADDITDPAKKTGDECWGGDNATMSLAGQSSQLVYAGNDTWRPKSDDGSRIQHVAAGDADGYNNGESWKVTTTDGTQYFFGRTTASAWTVPVFGNDAGEPCNHATFDTSSCQQAYRWNLDYVIDTHGNTITYTYAPETNNYSRNLNGAAPARYVRGGVLQSVEYGGRVGEHPLAQVWFDSVERGGPDVPTDQACADGANCGSRYSPSFWSTKRLSTITTRVWDGARYLDVDRWTLRHSYPANDDHTTASLWLNGITHTGLATAPNITLPEVSFDGTQLPNRINSDTDGLLPLDKWRLYRINTESGGTVSINYVGSDCLPTALPVAATNTKRCFPVTWTPEGNQLTHDWMSKYVVGTVSEEDRVGGQQTQSTSYDYHLGTPAWHFDDNPLVPEIRRTWNQYRGFDKVVVMHGDPAKGPPSATQFTYFRGMSFDHQPSGSRGNVWVVDSQNARFDDAEQWRGFLREKITYNGVNGPVVSSDIMDPTQGGPTATQGSLKSYVVQTSKVRTRTAAPTLPSGWRTTGVDTTYNAEGLQITSNDLGDVGVGTDDQCTTTTYARNDSTWLIDLPAEVKVDGVACSQPRTYPLDAIADEQTFYDSDASTAPGAPPTTGNVTKTKQLKAYSGATPTFVTTSTGTFDSYGRAVSSTDALNRTSTTAYTPAAGLPTTTTVTDPAGFATTTGLDVRLARPTAVTDANQNVSSLAYDALGRLTGVWLPGRKISDGPNTRYTYDVRNSGPSSVATDSLAPNNNYLTSYALYDGFMRARQTQTLGNGGPGKPPVRVLTDTLYDSHGLAFQNNGPYSDAGTPGTSLVGIADVEVPSRSVTTFDGAERPTDSALFSMADPNPLSRTHTAYYGDHVDVTPPTGATPTSTFTDARGRTTQLWQYHGGTPSGEHDVTMYTYNKAGQPDTLTDTAGNRWSKTYDLRGRRIAAVDPDAGNSTSTYDDAGQLTSTTDARGVTLAYTYDKVGRKTEERQGVGGPLLASWTFDPVIGGVPVKGQLGSSTRKVGNDLYTTTITGYDAGYRPTSKTFTLPASQSQLGTTPFAYSYSYKPDGSPATVDVPSLPGAAAEKLTYSYNSLGQPVTMSSATTTYVHDAAYTATGQLSQYQLGTAPKQVADTFYFDRATSRLIESKVDRQGAAGPISDQFYKYDPAGNVTSMADTAVADNQCFDYDALRRLTEAWTTTTASCGAPGGLVGGPAPYWTSYTYDAIGNRLSQTAHSTAALTGTNRATTYNHPAAGQPRPHALTSVNGAGLSATTTYAYDPAGNMISRPGQTLTWTPEGKVDTITTAAGTTTTNTYDADANLLATSDSAGSTLYLDDAELHYSKATNKRTATRYYSFGSITVGVRAGSALTWLMADHHGTDSLSVDSASLATTARRTDPFGNPRGTTPPAWPGDRGFVGGVNQAGVGLTHLGAREFDTQTGTFLSVDPVMDPNNPQQLNAYAYANNNPTTISDPSGTFYYLENDGKKTAPSAAATKSVAAADPVRRAERKDKRFASGGNRDMILIQNRNTPAPVPVDWACATGSGMFYGTDHCGPDSVRRADKIVKDRYDDYLERREHQSVSICASAGFALIAGLSAEGCLSLDVHGVTANGNISAQLNPKIGFSAGLDVRGSTNDAAGANRNPGAVRVEKTVVPGVKLGRYKTGSVSVQVNYNPNTGERNNTVKVGLIGTDFGDIPELGFGKVPGYLPNTVKYSLFAGNTGYIFRW